MASPSPQDDEELSPYLWLVQEEAGGATSSSSGAGRWAPLRPRDSQQLEQTFLEHGAGTVPIDFGRYDVDIQRRSMRAVYWDEPERRVLRSSWFYGRGNDRMPYEEHDAEDIEVAFQRLRGGRDRVPLLVPVNRGSHDVRFEALVPQQTDENALSALSFFIGTGPEKRYSVVAPPHPQPETGDESEGELQWTVVQESVDRTSAQPPVPVWRGHISLAEGSAEEDNEASLPEAVDCLVFVVHGIGQYQRSHEASTDRFYKEVSKLRNLFAKCLVRRMQDGLPVGGRVEFLPLEWFEQIHVDGGIGHRLRDVTLPSVGALRDFANFAIADIMVYLDDEWRERIHRELQRKMDRLYTLFRERVPGYSGEVSIIGHSLGAVIMFDLVQKSLPQLTRGLLADGPVAQQPDYHGRWPGTARHASGERKLGEVATSPCPAPRCFFAVGSPLGMFLSIRFSQRGHQNAAKYFRGLDVRWPAGSVGCGWRFFNVFHPDDPIAYRVEPLLNSDYRDTPPKLVLHRGGLRFHHQMREWWQRTVGGSTASRSGGEASPSETPSSGDNALTDVLVVPTTDAEVGGTSAASFFEDGPGRPRQTAAVDRLDYAIQESAFESMNELLSAIHSHFAYWDCDDLIQFITDQLADALEAKHRQQPPREGREGVSPRATVRRTVRREA